LDRPQVRSYRDLDVWKTGINLVQLVYSFGKRLPKSESFGLTSQMQRAAVSVPANIAEGHARKSSKEFLQFLSMSQGSLAEVETYFHIIERLQYVEPHEISSALEMTDKLGRMLRGLRLTIKAKVKA
jgi:four helix bundle protein